MSMSLNALALNFSTSPFEPDILVDEGQRLDDFGLDAHVVDTPGHTLGSVSLDLGDGVMVIGDAMINQIRVGMPLYGEDNMLAYDSLTKIQRTVPASRLYSGHGKPFSGRGYSTLF